MFGKNLPQQKMPSSSRGKGYVSLGRPVGRLLVVVVVAAVLLRGRPQRAGTAGDCMDLVRDYEKDNAPNDRNDAPPNSERLLQRSSSGPQPFHLVRYSGPRRAVNLFATTFSTV